MDFLCPITHEVMFDPVVTSSGHSYERGAIALWLRESNIDPKTGVRLTSKLLFPNHVLRSAIADAGGTPVSFAHEIARMDNWSTKARAIIFSDPSAKTRQRKCIELLLFPIILLPPCMIVDVCFHTRFSLLACFAIIAHAIYIA
jgi:hypothetical protein